MSRPSLERLGRLRQSWGGLITAGSPAHRWVMAILSIAVVAVAVWSASRLEISPADFSWLPLIGAVVLSLLGPVITAAEYRAGLRLIGRDTDTPTAIQVSVFGTLANVLPIPGGFLVKLKAMTEQGARARTAAAAQLLVGIVWLAMSGVLVAIALPRWRLAVVAVTAALFVASGAMAYRNRYSRRALAAVVGIEVIFLASAAARFYLVLSGLGIAVSGKAALALAASGPLAAATGIIPGSLGIYEAISAGLAALADLDPESGFLGALVQRVFTYLTLLPFVWWGRSRKGASPDTAPGS
ncbi:MAG TPA: lysylphosphatidylglycerol synthase domain-containing protein [Acidimicrobiia bacterium]